jgi:hypothetical protein
MATGPQRFVYYRVRRDALVQAQLAVRQMQDELRGRWPALQCIVLRRADAGAADTPTLMEIYDGLPSAEAALDVESLARERLAAWLVGERHVEAFEPCA